MALSTWELKEHKLSEVQEWVLLHIGGTQTMQSKHRMIQVCTYENGGYGKDAYWSGLLMYNSRKVPKVKPDAPVRRRRSKRKTVRVKTFFTLEKKGFLVLSDKEPNYSNSYLRAQLTDLGWEAFDILAKQAMATVTAYDNRLAALIADESTKPKVWDISMELLRKAMVPTYQYADIDYEGIEAATKEEAIAIAKERFKTDEKNWFDTGYYARNRVEKVWGEDALDDEAIEAGTEIVEYRDGTIEATEDEAYKQRAKARLNDVDQMLPPWRINGVKLYVEEGKRAPYLMDKILKATGGIRLDSAMAEDKPEDPDTAQDSEVGADMNRFAMLDLD